MSATTSAASKSTKTFVLGLAVGLVVGGLAGAYIGAFTDSGSIPQVKPAGVRPANPNVARDGDPASPGAPEEAPATPAPTDPSQPAPTEPVPAAPK